MPINDHQCQVAIGETIDTNRMNVEVNDANSSTLYTGRFFHLDSDGVAVEGVTGDGDPAFLAYRGVDRPSSGGAGIIDSSITGSWIPGETAGNGVVAGISNGLGYTILTSEYDSSRTYSVNDPVVCQTGSGAVTNHGTEGSADATAGSVGVVGWVISAPDDVNAQGGMDLIKIQLDQPKV